MAMLKSVQFLSKKRQFVLCGWLFTDK